MIDHASAPSVPPYFAQHVDDLADLQSRVAHDRWLLSTGQTKQLPDLAYAGPLVDGTLVRQALEHGDLQYAHELALWYFRVQLASATTQLRAAERATTTIVDGRELTRNQLSTLARSAPTTQERSRAADALPRVNATLRTERHLWLEAYAASRAQLGFSNHGAFVRALHPDVDSHIEHAQQWLTSTRSTFLETARSWRGRDRLRAPTMGDSRIIAGRAQVAATAASPLESIQSTLRLWGLLTRFQNLSVDDTTRPGKVGFAFCSPVRPPADIRISIPAGRTLGNYATTVHEFGHGIHFSCVAHPVDLWRVHPAVTEAFGFALEGVVAHPIWQSEHLGSVIDTDSVQRMLFAREWVRRVVAVSLCFEMKVHDGCADPATEYKKLIDREFGVEVDGAAAWDRLQTYLEGQPCYPLVYYQAFALREHLWNHLVGEVESEHWFSKPSAGRALQATLEMLTTTTPRDWLNLD